MVLFVIWPELFGYFYVGFFACICYRSLFHYAAALDRFNNAKPLVHGFTFTLSN